MPIDDFAEGVLMKANRYLIAFSLLMHFCYADSGSDYAASSGVPAPVSPTLPPTETPPQKETVEPTVPQPTATPGQTPATPGAPTTTNTTTPATPAAPVTTPVAPPLPMIRSASPEAPTGIKMNTFIEGFVWQVNENGIPIAIRTENTTVPTGVFPDGTTAFAPTSTLTDGKVKNIGHDWYPGFRVGMGYDWPRDHVDIVATWLRFHTGADRHLHADDEHQYFPSQLHPLDTDAGLPSQTATEYAAFKNVHAHWFVHLDQIDLDLGRAFYIGKWFHIRPHFGVRSTWLKRKLKVDYEDNLFYEITETALPGDDYNVRISSRWWGIGPEGGLEMSYELGGGVSLCGDLGGSIEYGFHHMRKKDIDDTLQDEDLESIIVNAKDSFHQSRPILDIEIGMKWTYLTAGEGCRFTVKGMWEEHVYYSQQQSLYFVDSTSIGSFIGNHGDVTFHGWTLGVRFDY